MPGAEENLWPVACSLGDKGTNSLILTKKFLFFVFLISKYVLIREECGNEV